MRRPRQANLLDDTPNARGAAWAAFGPLGFYLSSRRPRSGVRPLSLLGTVNATLWVAGVVAVALVGRQLVDGPRVVWGAAGVLVMGAVAWRWPWRRAA